MRLEGTGDDGNRGGRDDAGAVSGSTSGLPDAASSAPAAGLGPLPNLDGLRFEQLVALLESLTRRIAAGEVGIEEATALYEQAGLVHAAAERRLAEVTATLERLGWSPTGQAPTPNGGAGRS